MKTIGIRSEVNIRYFYYIYLENESNIVEFNQHDLSSFN